MSYDLYFMRRNRGGISVPDFEAYFRGRPHWSLQGEQAWYVNEDTGVYFEIRRNAPTKAPIPPEDAEDGDAFVPDASFNLNYFRPHYFGLEAEPEVAAFVSAFDLVVDDPQTEGMGRGEYSGGGFLSGWNLGNQLGYHVVAQHEPEPDSPINTCPTAELDRIWAWNYRKAELQAEIGEAVYVPSIVLVLFEGKLRSGVVWPDAIAELIPVVDLVFVMRNGLAPHRLTGKSHNLVCLPWADALSQFNAFPKGEFPVTHYRLIYEEAPAGLATFVRELPSTKSKPQIVSNDQVLNLELVEASRSRSS